MEKVHYKIGANKDLEDAMRETCKTPASLYLVDETGDALTDPTDEQLAEAQKKADEKTEANIKQMLACNPIVWHARERLGADLVKDRLVDVEDL